MRTLPLLLLFEVMVFACAPLDDESDSGVRPDDGALGLDGATGDSHPADGSLDAGFDDPVPGTYSGQMVGEVNGAAFRADLVIIVDDQWSVSGTWAGLELHDTWRGEVRGRAFAGGFNCPGASNGILCLSMTAPYSIITPAALFGRLGPGGGTGRFAFQVSASGDGGGGISGEGTWQVE